MSAARMALSRRSMRSSAISIAPVLIEEVMYGRVWSMSMRAAPGELYAHGRSLFQPELVSARMGQVAGDIAQLRSKHIGIDSVGCHHRFHDGIGQHFRDCSVLDNASVCGSRCM